MARTHHTRSLVRLVVATLAITAFMPVGAVPVAAAPSGEVTIDFSDHGGGDFDQRFFKKDGVVFTEGSFVGFVQGDDALVPGPMGARFTRPVTSISVMLAPAFQGTAEYTLEALDGGGRPIATTSTTVIQDTGDPDTGPFGSFTMELDALPKRAKAFRLSNRFVRSSFPDITTIQFGLASMTVTR